MIFLSHNYVSDTPTYGDRDKFKVAANSSIAAGGTANSSCWVFTNNHMGTHIDTPYHFDGNGMQTLDYPADFSYFNRVEIIDIPCDAARIIGPEDVAGHSIEPDTELLLIRTGFELVRQEDKYWNDNPGQAPELADYLRSNFPKMRVIGFEFMSVTSWKHRQLGRESHKAFLALGPGKTPILAIEDMALQAVTEPIEWSLVSPLRTEEGNGCPVTVFAKLTSES